MIIAKFVFNSYLIFTVVVFCPHFNAENVDKRILLKDPDLVHSQVQTILRELETVKTQLATQVNINSTKKRKLILLNAPTINLQAKVHVTLETVSIHEIY